MATATSIILSALLSSVITLLLVALVVKVWVWPQLLSWIDEVLLPEFREQVKNGAVDSGDTLLPQFRENVREGFNDAIRDQMAGQMFEDAARSVTKTMETGLGALFGRKPEI